MRRRGFWLIIIGFVNAVVFVPLDIIAIYGVTLLLMAPLVRAKDSVLLWTSLLTFIPATLMLAWQSVGAQVAAAAGTPVTMAQYMEPTFSAHILAGIPSWPVETVLSTVMILPGMLLGIWAARRRILDDPEKHLSLLRRITVTFLGVALIGRLPAALLEVGAWTVTSETVSWAVAIAHDLTGHLGGIGMAGAVALVAIGRKNGRLTTALAALGQRSMTFYLLQSVVWLVLFYPFTLALSDDMGSAAAFGIAIAVWVISILLADRMRHLGHRGPAEVLLRKLSYRRARSDRPASVEHAHGHGSVSRRRLGPDEVTNSWTITTGQPDTSHHQRRSRVSSDDADA